MSAEVNAEINMDSASKEEVISSNNVRKTI